MDETGVRALLERVADDPAPPSRVDIAAARQRGRRRIRRHRAALAAAPLAAAAAVALVVSGVIPASLGLGRGGGLHPGPVTPRSRFNPLMPYAGVRLAARRLLGHGRGRDDVQRHDQATTLTVIADRRATRRRSRLVTLTVSAAGACRITGPARDRVLAAWAGPAPSSGRCVPARAELQRWRRPPDCDAAEPGRPRRPRRQRVLPAQRRPGLGVRA